MEHFFAYLNRTKYIKRWGLMKNTETETLSEHLYQTAVLAYALAVIENRKFGGNTDPDRVAVMALFHDATEIITGDLPTPIKYHNDDIKKAYKAIEKETENILVDSLPEFMKEDFSPVIKMESDRPEELRILKAADTLSAYIKCMEELKAGNNDFSAAEKSIRKKLDSMDLGSLKYFMDEFLDSFFLPVDSL